jgi:hypothetical protein
MKGRQYVAPSYGSGHEHRIATLPMVVPFAVELCAECLIGCQTRQLTIPSGRLHMNSLRVSGTCREKLGAAEFADVRTEQRLEAKFYS